MPPPVLARRVLGLPLNIWLVASVVALLQTWGKAAAPLKPHVVFILADDLAYGELGCYGQTKIRTPHLDRLAASGMRLTQHYAGSPVCAPSRCVLMTGRHAGHAWVRDNLEVQPEGQWPLPFGSFTLGRLFQEQGFVSGAFGKWGLSGPGSLGHPLDQGFDQFFGYLCQRVAHNYDLSHDPQARNGVADAHPEVLADLERTMSAQHTPSREFPISGLDASLVRP